MNKLQQVIDGYRKMYSAMFGTLPVSPVPEGIAIDTAHNFGNELRKVPSDIIDGLGGAIELTPPAQVLKQVVATRAYEPYITGVRIYPEKESRRIQMDNFKNLERAKKLIMYGSLLRPFMRNPMDKQSYKLIRQNGNRWIEVPQDTVSM
jgi:hypothetical protein